MAAQFKVTELTVIGFVQMLFDLETEFVSKFNLLTVQEDWLLKTRHYIEKYEKKLRLKKLKKIRKLASNEVYILRVWNVLRVITNIFV